MADWYVGQPIVCVKGGRIYTYTPPMAFPVQGQQYTIRSILEIHGRIGFYVEEITNKPVLFFDTRRWGEPTYDPLRFRPCLTTNIDAFKSILAPTRERELVDA